jgi:hypothetical protein
MYERDVIEKPEEKRPLGNTGCRVEDNVNEYAVRMCAVFVWLGIM